MNSASQHVLAEWITGNCHDLPKGVSKLAGLYMASTCFLPVLEYAEEQYWLRTRTENSAYALFLAELFAGTLRSVDYLEPLLLSTGPKPSPKLSKNALDLQDQILEAVRSFPLIYRKSFLARTLEKMKVLFLEEEARQTTQTQSEGHQGPRYYHAFDSLDDLFQFDYGLDHEMTIDPLQKERLYQGSGVGVQSGYSTILLSLHALRRKQHALVVDLGSGYGRVGMIFALMHPDSDFIGYEHVPHRVENSNRAAAALKLQGRLQFIAQDLSSTDFQIPAADVFYLYDPFTKDTYEHVLQQLVGISLRKQITVVTKGNARQWLLEVAEKQQWPAPTLIDHGNLCLFTSRT